MSPPREGARGKGLTVALSIECDYEEVATALEKTLMPDNRYFPKDQRFSSSRDGRFLMFEVASPRARPALTTMRSIVADAKLFRDVWVEVRTRRAR